MRPLRSLSRHAPRLAFALAYCLTLLPFTVRFFEGFVSPPPGFWKNVYLLALPAFLFSLEYAGISLAVLFWRERKGEILALFAACQALAVSSAFYDVRAAEWEGMRALRTEAVRALDRTRTETERAAGTRRAGLTRRLERALADAASVRAEMRATSTADAGGGVFEDRVLEGRRLGQRERVLADYRGALGDAGKEVDRLRTEISATYAEAPPVRTDGLPGTDAPTALAYIGGTIGEGPSFAALGLALLFPVTVLAMGRVVSSSEAPPGPSASADLRRELAEGAALPEERHVSYAALLEPVLAAHVASVRSARSAAARGLALSVEIDAEIDALATVASLRDQIESSGLSAPGRQRLVAFVDRLLSDGLDPAPSAA